MAGLRELRINKSRLEKGCVKAVEKLRTLEAGISEIEVEELRTYIQNIRGGCGNYNSGYFGGLGRLTVETRCTLFVYMLLDALICLARDYTRNGTRLINRSKGEIIEPKLA